MFNGRREWQIRRIWEKSFRSHRRRRGESNDARIYNATGKQAGLRGNSANAKYLSQFDCHGQATEKDDAPKTNSRCTATLVLTSSSSATQNKLSETSRLGRHLFVGVTFYKQPLRYSQVCEVALSTTYSL